jgi:hypothetical protein
MRVLVFSLENEDVILASLRKSFPEIGFRKCKANENIEDEGRRIVLLDTIPGIRKTILIDSLDSGWLRGGVSRAVSLMRIMRDVGALESARVIAVPEGHDPARAIAEISLILKEMC